MALNDDSRGSIFGNRNDDNSNDLSSSFDLFSKSLSNTSEALKGNTKGLSLSSLSLDKNTDALLEIAKLFGKSVKDLDKNTRKSGDKKKKDDEDFLANMKEVYERSNKNLDTSLTRVQKWGNIIITSFEVVGKRVIGNLESAANRVASKYKEQLSNITVRMQMTNSDYSDMFNAMSSRFQSEGLAKQFSPVDYADALAATLENGLRGDEAQRQAYHNLITNKLIPAISTNTIAYRRMSKQFQNSFDQNVVAVSKYTEALYGAEGLEQGKANAIYETLESRLRYEESVGNLDEGGVEKVLNQIQFAVSKMEAAGINTDQFISDIGSILEGNTAESTALMQRYFGVVDTDQFAKKLSTDAFGFVEDYMRAYNAGSATLATANEQWSALGGNLTTGMQTTTALNNYEKAGKDFFGELRDEFSRFNSEAEYERFNQRLKNGDFQTKDAQLDKLEENMTTSYGVFKSEFVPRFDEVASDVKSILGVVINMLLFTKTKSALSGESDSKLVSKLLNLGNKGEALSSFSQLVGSGTGKVGLSNLARPLSGIKSGITGAGSATGALINLAAGPGALIAGGLLAGYQGFKSGQVAAQEGGNFGGVAGQTLRGIITGGTMKTSEEVNSAISQALKGQKQKLDLSEIGTNAVKGGLLGVGVGTAVGGWAAGAGTAIGAGIGAITGAVTNLIDQATENAKFNKLANAVNNFNKSLSETKTSLDSYKTVIEKSKFTYNSLKKLTGEVYASESEKLSVLESLKEQYPALLTNVENLSDFDSEYVKIIEQKIEREKALAGSKAVSSLSDLVDQAVSGSSATRGLLKGDKILGREAMNFINEIGSEEKAQSMSQEELLAKASEYADKAGLTTDEFINKINSATNGGFFAKSYNNPDDLTDYDWVAMTTTWGDNYKQAQKAYDESGVLKDYDTSGINEALEEDYVRIQNLLAGFDELVATVVSDKGSLSLTENQIRIVSSKIGALEGLMKDYNYSTALINSKDSQIHSDNKMFDSAKKMAEASGVSFPKFKLGAYRINEDNLLSVLHKDEMVLTSANANKLRNLGSGGISGLLDALTAVSSARVSAVDSTSNTASLCNAVVSAINSQTESIVAVLNSILGVVMRIGPVPSRDNSARLSDDLLSFSGV